MKTNCKNLNPPEGNLHLIPCPSPWQGEGCPEGGLRFFPGRKFRGRTAGFTLIEVLIGIGISAILILGLTRLLSATLNSYSLQEQLTEMNQNAKFAMKELSDVLMQAGADCQLVSDTLDLDTIISVVSAPPCSSFTIKVNPRGGFFTFTSKCTLNTSSASCSIQVDNALPFLPANKIGRIPEDSSANAVPHRYVKTYTLKGIDTLNNKVIITGGASGDIFFAGDGIYSFNSQSYYLKGTNLCLNSDTNVLAENIDSLKITFMDSAGTTINSSSYIWSPVKSVKLFVDGITSLPDNRYNGYGDHHRHLPLTYQFRLKNKV
jgi:prepilin-type N-terminal cleavage/methylation domain-containing protein